MPIGEIGHPLVFGVVVAEVASLVIFAHLGIVSLLSYRATRQGERRIHAWWCFWSATLTSCFLVLGLQLPTWAYVVALHGMSVAGPMAMRYYMGAIAAHLRLKDPWIDGLRRWQPVVAIYPLLSLASFAVMGEQFFLFERATEPTSLLVRIVHRTVPANEVHPVFAVVLLAMLVADVGVLLRGAFGAPRKDGWIVVGIAITCASIAFEVLAMHFGLEWAVPTIFAANLIEVVRITYVSTVELGREKAQLEQLTAEIGHELRNPMSSARLFIDAARRRSDGDERVQRALEKAGLALQQAVAVVEGIDLDRPSKPRACALKTVAHHALAICEPKLAGLRVDNEVPDGLVVWASPSSLLQILVNLIDNAAEAVGDRPGAWIHLVAVEGHRDVELRVSDAGDLPPASIRHRLFRQGFTTKRRRGRGIGLAVARRLARDQGGALELDDEAPTTTFVMRLPKLEAMSVHAAAE